MQIDIKAGEKKSITRQSCGFTALRAIVDAVLASTFLCDIENRRPINVRARNLHLSRHAGKLTEVRLRDKKYKCLLCLYPYKDVTFLNGQYG